MSEKVMVQIQFLDEGMCALTPSYQTVGASGMDVCAAQDFLLGPLERGLIPSGFAMSIPLGYEIQVRPRSGLAYKHGVTVLNAPGTIDADYRGELKILLINLGKEDFQIRRGDRIAQLVLAPVSFIEWTKVVQLDSTQRGEGGFGHTGH